MAEKKGRKIRMDEMVDDETKRAALKELRDAQIAKDAAMMRARYPAPQGPAPAPQGPTPAPQMPPPGGPQGGPPPAPPAGNAPGMKKGGKIESMGPRTMSKDVEKGSNKLTKFGESAVQKRGHTKGKNFGDSGPTRMAKGGSASSRGDGIAQRGKTRGKYC